MTIQDVINKIGTYADKRRKDAEAAYDRQIHNEDIENLKAELNENLDE